MKRSIFIFLMAFSVQSFAQVFKFSPKYDISTSISDIHKSHTALLSAEPYDRGEIVIDLDRKTLVYAIAKQYISDPQILQIDEVKYNQKVARYDIKIKLENRNVYQYQYFRLQMDPDEGPNEIKYIREAHVGEFTKNRDTSFSTYTNDFHHADWTSYHFRYGDRTTTNKPEIISQENTFDMRNGSFIWTSGKGKDKTTKVYKVAGSDVAPDGSRANLICETQDGLDLGISIFRKGDNMSAFGSIALVFLEPGTNKAVKKLAFE